MMPITGAIIEPNRPIIEHAHMMVVRRLVGHNSAV